jgi:hypothetical protein
MKLVWACFILLTVAAASCGPKEKFCLPQPKGNGNPDYTCREAVVDSGSESIFIDSDAGLGESTFIGGNGGAGGN